MAPLVWPLTWQDEARDADARLERDAVVGLVEPRRRRGPQQLLEPFHLLGRQQPVEDLVVVAERDLAAARDVAQLLVRGQEHRRRKLRQVGVGDVEVDVDALVLGMHRDPALREHHVGRRLQRMRQRLVGEQVLLLDLLGRHRCQRLPARDAVGQARHRPGHDRLAARHERARDRAAREVVAAVHVGVHVCHQLRLLLAKELRPTPPTSSAAWADSKSSLHGPHTTRCRTATGRPVRTVGTAAACRRGRRRDPSPCRAARAAPRDSAAGGARRD